MKKFFIYLILIVLLIQIIRPNKNRSETVSATAIVAPENIQIILDKSCNDCHSNNTNYEWYHNISPISWIVSLHVKDGKDHVNFDIWTSYNKDQKKHIIKDLKKSIETREMPLVGYLKVHPEAVISDEENQELLDWIATLKSE